MLRKILPNMKLDIKNSAYAANAFSRLLSRLLRRAARFLWCKPLDTARSILETAERYAVAAPSLFLSAIIFNSALIDERRVERWLIL